MFARLSEDSLLDKCLHGKTQNQNKSISAMVRERVPNEVYVGRETVEFGMYDAVAHFNDGSKTVIDLYKALEITPGKYTEGCQTQDQSQIYNAEFRSMEITKQQ